MPQETLTTQNPVDERYRLITSTTMRRHSHPRRNVAESGFSDNLWNALRQQLLECSLLLGVLENSLWNYGERSGAPVQHIRVSIDQRSRINTPLQMGVDVRCLEVNALLRKRE